MDQAIIQLCDVSRTVQSGNKPLTILFPLDLSIHTGDFVSIVGPSGSGKSTLLGLIAGLDAPTTGSVLVGGHDITAMTEDRLATLRGRMIGFIFQAFHLIPALTALENVAIPLEIAGKPKAMSRAADLLAEVGLKDRVGHYPAQLSGGEQQRVAIARAFANDPPILLADEPTGNLDTLTGRQIFSLLVDLNRSRNTTLILVTHDHDLAGLADRRISLSAGRISADERPGSEDATESVERRVGELL